MSDPHNTHGWTFNSLMVHIDARFDALTRLVEERDDARREALAKAETTAAALLERVGRFTTRTEVESLAKGNANRITALEHRADTHEGTGAGLNRAWIYIIAFVGIVGTFASIALVLDHFSGAVTVTALLLSCEACGMTARVARNDYQTFAAFFRSHYLPVIDHAEVNNNGAVRLVEVEVTP